MNFSDSAEREWILLYGVSSSFTDENDVPDWWRNWHDLDSQKNVVRRVSPQVTQKKEDRIGASAPHGTSFFAAT